MLSLVLMLILISSFFIGRRRGFILQLVHLLGFIVAFLVAYHYYSDVALYIRLWIPYPQFSTDSTVSMIISAFDFESVYYSGIAFAILFFGTKILMQIIGSMLDFLAHLPILRSVNRLLGGLLCLLEAYLLLFILLYVGALLPIEQVQGHLQGSLIAQLMMNHTPFLSDWLQELWVNNPL
ncbi:CvpA family protein [Halalkalibacterium ligniniphilum]|uniref:CvpA family protein n=1 Tax=Halalkalibacterium ligniniphilum TaxID=1134413 RepID=UPI00034A87CC|nr:CvpA family protein [Halalkalibacterium ligniniphilum]